MATSGKITSEKAPASAMTSAAAERAPKTDAELRNIMKTLVDNPESISDIPDDDIIEIKKRINPIGTFAPMQKSFAIASVVNMKDTDMRKFITTAMIGFIYRRLSEYVPDYVTRIEDQYAAKINTEQVQERRDGLRAECTKITDEYKNANRKVIQTFLDSIFCFNPDKHVRKAPADLPIDAVDIIAGATPPQPAASSDSKEAVAAPKEASAASSSAKTAELQVTREAFTEATATLKQEVEKYQPKPEPKDPAERVALAKDIEQATYEAAAIVYRTARIVSGNLAQGYRLVSEEMQDTSAQLEPTGATSAVTVASSARVQTRLGQMEDVRQLLQKCRTRIDDAASIVGPYVAGKSVLEATNVLQVAPPADVFYHFSRYIDSHYEVLRILTDVIYQTPPGIENVVIYYDTFEDLDRAKEYIRVHEAEFRADPKIIENGGVTILGPFRENRDKVDFYNRNTEVLRVMMEQVARDHELGKDLTKSRLMNAKKKNLHETGPDDPGLDKYVAARNIISQFGKKPELSREDREKLIRAEQDRAEFETPDGALTMRVLAPTLDENGVPTDLKQTFFYAEAANVSMGKGDGKSGGPGGASSSGAGSSKK